MKTKTTLVKTFILVTLCYFNCCKQIKIKDHIKNITHLLLIIFYILIFISCTPSEKESNTNNLPPTNFDLIAVANNSDDIDITGITFSWQTSYDSDGDDSNITYTVYFGTDLNSIDISVEITQNSSFNFTDRLNTCTTYYWNVVAKDEKGGETTSISNFKFTTRKIAISTTPLNSNASFPVRYGHQTITFNNRLWLIGGTTKEPVTNSYHPFNDVYSTLDGLNWEEMTDNAQFSGRYGHASVAFNNKMWVIGGNDGQPRNDVWSSTNGFTWTQETANAEFSATNFLKAIVFKNKVWLFQNNEIWNSDNGVNWTIVNTLASFMPREGYSVTVFNDEIWVIGGRTDVEDLKNDVWKSTDGITWSLATNSAPFSPRLFHSTVVFDDNLYLIGGMTQPVLGASNDIWKTTDGNSWVQITNNAHLNERLLHTTISYKEKLWLIAGTKSLFDGLGFNDVWGFY